MNIGILILALIFIAGFGALLWIFGKEKRPQNDQAFSMMNENLNNMTKTMFAQLNEVTKQVNIRLKENADILAVTNKTMSERLDNSARVTGDMIGKMAKMEEANKRIHDVGKDIASLQEILRAPKMRGGLGELFLGDLLAQYFPKGQYEMQYRFKSGEAVDAVIKLRDGRLVSIDSKFPLENFQKMIAADLDADKKKHRRTFKSDVKKHIDSIASKYILPDEGTLDFALIYIHAENVYYEIITKDDEGMALDEYARQKKVIPVSPNNFFVYLQTILFGLRGLEVEKHALEIQKNLSQLKTDFMKFGDDFQVLGKHLGNAQGKYEESEKRLLRFTDRLERVHVEGEEDKLIGEVSE